MLRDYDIQTYNDMETMLIEYGECCLVGHTGIGKTRISMEFVERYNLNTLVISNRLSINKSWEKTAAENGVVTISTVTIQTFVKAYKMFVDGFDCYIFDEAHHLGANTWFTAYKKFRQIISEECFIIGATATSKRYFDGKGINDITESVFDNHAVYCINRKEAIELGIISNASYVYALYNVSEYAKKYFDKDMTDELRGKLDFAVKNQPQIADILIKYAPKGNKKGIVYVDRIKSIDDAVQLISTAFPKDPVWYIHSKLPAEEVATVYEEFAKCKNGFIINVDMISEGIHPNDVNMVVMLRKTISPNKFTQQSGRVSNTKDAVIFDFVGNRTSIANIIARNGVTIGKRNNKKKEQSTSCDVGNNYHMEIVDAYTSDFLSILDEIDKYNKRGRCYWTEEEDNIIREYYPSEGYNVCKRLNYKHSKYACQQRAAFLGIRTMPLWTPEEDEIIKKYWSTEGKDVYKRLSGKSVHCCARRASVLGITKKFTKWTSEEDEILKKYYPTEGTDVYKRLPDRSSDACRGRLQTLGIRSNNWRPKWTPEEDEILKNFYPYEGREVCNRLIDKTPAACVARANKLGIVRKHKWAKQEDEMLREFYSFEGGDVYKRLPGKTKSECHNRANVLGLKYFKRPSRWNNHEIDILIKYYPSEGGDVYKRLPGRSIEACRIKAGKIGLMCNNCWIPEEDEILKKFYPLEGMNVSERLPGRSGNDCNFRATKLGLKRGAQ